jgi:hypothetical protein
MGDEGEEVSMAEVKMVIWEYTDTAGNIHYVLGGDSTGCSEEIIIDMY